jgi:primosomal protein N''
VFRLTYIMRTLRTKIFFLHSENSAKVRLDEGNFHERDTLLSNILQHIRGLYKPIDKNWVGIF